MVDDLKHIDGTEVDNKERENEDITNYFKVINQKFNKQQAKQGESDINKLTQYDPLNNNLWVKRKTEYTRIFKSNKKEKVKNNNGAKFKGYGCESEEINEDSKNENHKSKKSKISKKKNKSQKSSQNNDINSDNNSENNVNNENNDMVDSDDDLVLKDKNDILYDELNEGNACIDNENQKDEHLYQFDLFGKILNHNAKFERQKKVITATEDQIEFIDENLMYTVNNETVKYEYQFEQEQERIREEIRQEKLAEVKEEICMVNEFDEMLKENEKMNEKLENEDGFNLGLFNFNKSHMPEVDVQKMSAFKRNDEHVDLSIKRQRKELNIDYENVPIVNPNKEKEYSELEDYFKLVNSDYQSGSNYAKYNGNAGLGKEFENNQVDAEEGDFDIYKYHNLGYKLKFVKSKNDKKNKDMNINE
eukprot:Mrub_03867.p1 GENE.Mrub_03867~~Mrub_03867.p1  ORF type:complete len:454 (+),score=142.25 Mrub_03867:106-1362(+)